MSYRAKCRGRRARRQVVSYGRLRRAHERMFLHLEAMRPPEVTGDPLADMWRREMYGAAQVLTRNLHVALYGPRFQTWTERYREKQEARRA
jgi:hypothetical protein